MKVYPLHGFATLLRLVLALAFVLPGTALALSPAENSAIYMYQGPDRDQRVLEGAKKEGIVSIYTSLNLKDSLPITEAFEKKYGIKVALWRGGSEKVLARAVTEARAGRFTPDIIESNSPEMEAMSRENLLSEFYSPIFKDLPPYAFPKHRLYVADRIQFFVLGYNTNLVKPEDVPKTYEDLLNPKWKGQLAIDSGDSDWFTAVVKSMGEEKGLAYFRKLAANEPQMRKGHTLMGGLLSAGEMPLAILYDENVVSARLKGGPVDAKVLEPLFGRSNSIGVAKHAPHPYAALLYADFMLSTDGQELLKKRNYVPVNNAVDSPFKHSKYEIIDPVVLLDEADKWVALWDQIFLHGIKQSTDEKK